MKISLFQKASLILLAGLVTEKGIEAQERKDIRPNVIFILADDAGYGDFGIFGQKEILTPNLDRMGEEGLLFTDHYAGAPVCAPSRSSLLTGQHTGHTPVRGNKEIQPEGQFPLPEESVTIGEMLQDAGVATAAIGKWGLGYPRSTGAPENQGFDYFYGYNCQRQAHNYYPDHLWENDKRVELDGETYTHDLITDKALDWIDENKEESFFLYLAYAIPHAALQIPHIAPYEDKNWPENMKKYAAMMSLMDRDIGRLLSKLDEMGIDENTLVLFSSDNGPHGEGGADPDFFESSGPFRGMKRDLYEGGIRVPLIARWPGTIEPGRESDHISAFWDFMPTVADIYGLSNRGEIDGLSYYQTLLGQEEKQRKHNYLYWEFHENGGIQAVRMGNWKGVRKFVRLLPDGPIELYNLADDKSESRNVARENRETADLIKKLMSESHRESEDFPLLGKTPFRMAFENGWLFLIPLILSQALIIIIKKRKGNKVGNEEKRWIRLLRISATSSLIFISCFSPLMVMSRWFTASAVTALIGIIFNGAGTLLSKNKMSDTGLFIFWAALGSSAPSWPFMVSLIFWLGARIIIPVDEKLRGTWREHPVRSSVRD